MYANKSLLRLEFIKKRKKIHKRQKPFPFDKIFTLIKKNFQKKKISVAGYYPSNFEVNILNFLFLANKKKIKVGLPVTKKNNKMVFKYWTPNEPLYVNKYGILEPQKKKYLI